jgi:hypothetical protein
MKDVNFDLYFLVCVFHSITIGVLGSFEFFVCTEYYYDNFTSVCDPMKPILFSQIAVIFIPLFIFGIMQHICTQHRESILFLFAGIIMPTIFLATLFINESLKQGMKESWKKDVYYVFIPGYTILMITVWYIKNKRSKEEYIDLNNPIVEEVQDVGDGICILCKNNAADTAVIPCGHKRFCKVCIQQYQASSADNICPVPSCGRDICMTRKIFTQ